VPADYPWWNLFQGIALPIQVLFWIVLAIGLSSLFSVTVLAINAARQRHKVARDRTLPSAESDYLWVFMVAALNEEITIADAVGRLSETEATNRVILVINDGSDDSTGDILAAMNEENLHVLTRVLPHARKGKAAALNDAYRYLLGSVLVQPRYAHWSHERVIVGVIDADGRLDPLAPNAVAWHFTSRRIGGVQSLVRIYNVRGYLTWAQDVEFSAVGRLAQMGRSWWGTANMGGNGQFNRLSALDDVADAVGPWRDRLTEDQDLGIRLIQEGWRSAQENSISINQQGLHSFGRLYRQRTRWAQGAWEALPLLRGLRKSRLGFAATCDFVYYLLTPVLQLITGAGLIFAIIINFFRDVPFIPSSIPVLLFFISLGYLPGLITLLHRGRGVGGTLLAVVLSFPYLVYSWMLFPVLVQSLYRHLTGSTGWSKTAREHLEPQTDVSE
jgi:cellulose synthase/poly-beta-1,6-N-acetylglucosamine synthase-like glycosyltransferase